MSFICRAPATTDRYCLLSVLCSRKGLRTKLSWTDFHQRELCFHSTTIVILDFSKDPILCQFCSREPLLWCDKFSKYFRDQVVILSCDSFSFEKYAEWKIMLIFSADNHQQLITVNKVEFHLTQYTDLALFGRHFDAPSSWRLTKFKLITLVPASGSLTWKLFQRVLN